MRIENKKILLGISGAIAAYKSLELIRLLREQGAHVRVVMTESAKAFIAPLTFQALSGHPVLSEQFGQSTGTAMPHIELPRWADVVLIAPATADVIAQLSYGHGGDLLTTLCLASNAPLLLAPSMNQQMWQHPAVQENIGRLQKRGVRILGPDVGAQACGEFGPGRMVEPEALLREINNCFTVPVLVNCRVLISAGATREALDPVRYLSNRSSGKMGFELAKAASAAGAYVEVVSGPTVLTLPSSIPCHWVESTSDMYQKVMHLIDQFDIFIGAAAVCDYRAAVPVQNKIKKVEFSGIFKLVPTVDIIAELAQLPKKPFLIGFSLETESGIAAARHKLHAKGLNVIVANWTGERTGFEVPTNAVTILTAEEEWHLPLASKMIIAQQIIERIAGIYASVRISSQSTAPIV